MLSFKCTHMLPQPTACCAPTSQGFKGSVPESSAQIEKHPAAYLAVFRFGTHEFNLNVAAELSPWGGFAKAGVPAKGGVPWTVQGARKETAPQQPLYKPRQANFTLTCVMRTSIRRRMRRKPCQHIARLSLLSQVTTKMPPSFNGKTSWFAFACGCNRRLERYH